MGLKILMWMMSVVNFMSMTMILMMLLMILKMILMMILKMILMMVLVTLPLLVTYHFLVRGTAIGVVLSGRRYPVWPFGRAAARPADPME